MEDLMITFLRKFTDYPFAVKLARNTTSEKAIRNLP